MAGVLETEPSIDDVIEDIDKSLVDVVNILVEFVPVLEVSETTSIPQDGNRFIGINILIIHIPCATRS